MPHQTDQAPDSDAGGWESWVPESVRHLLPTAVPAEDWTRYVPAEWRRWLSDSPAPRPQTRTLRLIGIDEDRPGPRWSALYAETWDAYRAWWLRADGRREPPGRGGRRGGASSSHARAGGGARAAGVAARGRRHGRRHAHPVEPATVHRGLLPGGRARPRGRRAGAASQLRLRPAPVRGDDLPLALVGTARARH